MSIVKDGKVRASDQTVDHEKYDTNYDDINWNSKRDSDESSDEDK